jgi:hypothetical protein
LTPGIDDFRHTSNYGVIFKLLHQVFMAILREWQSVQQPNTFFVICRTKKFIERAWPDWQVFNPAHRKTNVTRKNGF